MHFLSPNSFIGRWISFLFDALLISVAWAICSAPIITLGASTAALNRVAQNWMRNRSDCDLKHFFLAFKENFKGATMVWLILMIPLAFVLFNVYNVWLTQMPTTSGVFWMTVVAAAVWIATAVYAFALQATFENTPMRTVLNALRIAAAHFTTTVILIVLFALAIAMTVILPYAAFAYTPLCVFLAARPVWNVFQKVMGRPEVIVENTNENEEKGE